MGGQLSPQKISRYSRYTTWPVLDEASWAHGVIKDTAPVALPAGAVSDATNYLFDRPGVAHKRGGLALTGAPLGVAGEITNVAVAPFVAGTRLLATAPGGAAGASRLYDITASADTGTMSITSNNDRQKPVFYNEKMIYVGGATAAAPRKAVLTAGNVVPSALGGSPPAAKYACPHGGYLVLANTAANPNRLWFSPVPDIEAAWDTANAYIDTNEEITGLASVQGVLVVFHVGSTERVIGSTPPGTVGENMALQPLARGGCVDARTLVYTGDSVLYADQEGVWMSNGSSVASLTEKPNGLGISSYWRTLMSAYSYVASTSILSAGIFGSDYYLVSLVTSNTLVTPWTAGFFLCCYLPTGAWMPFDGMAVKMFSQGMFSPAPEVYVGLANTGQCAAVSDLFAATPTNKKDLNLTAVIPSLTTRVLGSGPYLKAWGHGHITYDMRDAASDNPTMAITVAPGIEQTTFAAVVEGTPLVETTDATRKRFVVSKDSQGMSVKLTQTNASSRTEIYAVEVEARPYGESVDGN